MQYTQFLMPIFKVMDSQKKTKTKHKLHIAFALQKLIITQLDKKFLAFYGM